MVTLLGSLLGFFSATLPDVFQLWNQHSKRRYELKLLEKKSKNQQKNNQDKSKFDYPSSSHFPAHIQSFHNSRSWDKSWSQALRSSVRPVISYAFFSLFAGVKIAMVYQLMDQGESISTSLMRIWDEQTQALFAVVMSFWFGQRSLEKLNFLK